MTLREFWRYHFLKVLLILVVIQIGVIAFIQNYNHKPVAVRDIGKVIENRKLKISPLLNDTDKDENTELSIASFAQPEHGTVEQRGNLLYYSPAKNFFGSDSIQYIVGDGKKTSKPNYISIEVTENLPPEVVPDTVTVYAGKTIFISPLGNDSDLEEDSIFISEFTQAEKGTLIKEKNGFYYTAPKGSATVEKFTYKASDWKSTSEPTSVLIKIQSSSEALYPWMAMDIGNTALKGTSEKTENGYTLTASGADIWGNADAFQFMYQYVEGDCEFIAKVESIEGTEGWVKAGIMVRENLSPGAKCSFVVLSNSNGATVHQRLEQNDGMQGTDKHPEGVAPYWVKLQRKGNEFSYSFSENGANWTVMETFQNPMSENVYIGVVCTSHNNEELATIEYSHLKIIAHEVKL